MRVTGNTRTVETEGVSTYKLDSGSQAGMRQTEKQKMRKRTQLSVVRHALKV